MLWSGPGHEAEGERPQSMSCRGKGVLQDHERLARHQDGLGCRQQMSNRKLHGQRTQSVVETGLGITKHADTQSQLRAGRAMILGLGTRSALRGMGRTNQSARNSAKAAGGAERRLIPGGN